MSPALPCWASPPLPHPHRPHQSHRPHLLLCGATPPPPSRVALRLQYNGASFHGWESKPGLRTVETTLHSAVSAITGIPTPLTAASRTDAAAHAAAQVVHFDVAPARALARASAWVSALNRRLPSDARVLQAAFATQSFCARRSARARRYRYTMRTAGAPCVFTAPFVWHYYARPLDVGVMHAAAQLLRSAAPRDMSAFRKKRASARHTMITVSDVQVRAVGGSGALVELEVTADWFVYGMMRLLAATLVRVGAGQLTVAEFGEIVENGLRDRVTFSAPANGLCLLQVTYPRDVDPFPLAKEAEGTEGVVHVATADVSNS